MASAFPPVVPSSGGNEDAGAGDGGTGVEEVGCWGEEFIGGGEDAGGEGSGDKIYRLRGRQRRAVGKVMKREFEGGGPMQVELKVGVMRSVGMESVVVGVD